MFVTQYFCQALVHVSTAYVNTELSQVRFGWFLGSLLIAPTRFPKKSKTMGTQEMWWLWQRWEPFPHRQSTVLRNSHIAPNNKGEKNQRWYRKWETSSQSTKAAANQQPTSLAWTKQGSEKGWNREIEKTLSVTCSCQACSSLTNHEPVKKPVRVIT